MAIQSKYYGIKFPFSNDNDAGLYVDLDEDYASSVRSKLIHLLYTKKGERVRMPEFGTNLLSFIFGMLDDKEKTDIKIEIQEAVAKYVPEVTIVKFNIQEASVYTNDTEPHGINVELIYSINGTDITDTITTAITEPEQNIE